MRRRPGTRVQALSEVSFAVREGEVFGLLGPNGAGKTTLIKILATLILPDTGVVKLCGHDVASEGPAVRRLIGLVNTSERSFYWRLTGSENLRFFATLHGLTGRDRKERIQKVLTLLDLTEKADTQFMKYSTGQQQRLAVARALLTDPQVLLMDEATRSFDPIAAADLRRLVTSTLVQEQGRTVIWCTHNLREAEEICDRLAFIHQGRVAACGWLDELRCLVDVASQYRLQTDHLGADLLGGLGYPPSALVRNNGYLEVEIQATETEIPPLLKNLAAAGGKVFACSPKGVELEDVFTRFTANEKWRPGPEMTK